MESLEEAYAMLRSQRENETRSSKDRFRLFGSIATQYVLFGKGERAIEIAEQIEDENESMTALAQVASLLADGGGDELARRAVNAIPEDANRTFALIGMSDAKAGTEQRMLPSSCSTKQCISPKQFLSFRRVPPLTMRSRLDLPNLRMTFGSKPPFTAVSNRSPHFATTA